MNEWAMIFGMALVTFGVRYPVLAIFSRVDLPEPIIRALRFVPVAVLTAIIVPALLFSNPETPNQVDLSLTNAYLVAGVVSVGIALYSKKLLPTIVLGMAFFLAWRAIFGA